jgi:hypothetical protein
MLAWQRLDKHVTVDETFYDARNKPLTQVTKREPGEHTPSQYKGNYSAFVITTEQLALDLSAHTLSCCFVSEQ